MPVNTIRPHTRTPSQILCRFHTLKHLFSIETKEIVSDHRPSTTRVILSHGESELVIVDLISEESSLHFVISSINADRNKSSSIARLFSLALPIIKDEEIIECKSTLDVMEPRYQIR
ncbi:Hypothetical predicted protein [Octopus vulgaris]|uniref:Uncharacterized protein n=1 Tax=Octopus vulgaris TaxID=6645 RepID=A0AA36EYA7_OCTVU|nr:Hypothetical predicted protein [Octopus vulgaris]